MGQNTATPEMKPLPLWKHAVAYVTLGLLCGWYYLLVLVFPLCVIFALRGSYIAGSVIALLVGLTLTPISHKPWKPFIDHWIWKAWREYFEFSFDCATLNAVHDNKQRYLFFEYPHGVFPLGPFLSVGVVDQITPGRFCSGTAADAVFKIPVMRQIMAWTGTHPANRKNIHKILESGDNCAVVVGGIAEMYLLNDQTEAIFLKKRLNTVRIAIQEGAHIVPLFFFGNSRLFDVAGNSPDSWLARFSRKIRTSLLFFYGRQGLPVPYRHPIRMVTGEIVKVEQKDNPSEEEVQKVMDQVVESFTRLYAEKKPAWETRPLVIH